VVGVDDGVVGIRVPQRKEGLANRQRGAAIRETNLDHDSGLFSDEQVSQDLTVPIGQSHPFEVTFDRARAGPTSASLRRAERTMLRSSALPGIPSTLRALAQAFAYC
jgi:hypothetical protein